MIPIYSKSLRIRKTLELYIICNDPADHRMLTGVQNFLHKQTNESYSPCSILFLTKILVCVVAIFPLNTRLAQNQDMYRP